MKNLIALIIFLFATMQTQGQTISEKELTGKWKVVKVDMLVPDVRKEQTDKIEMLKKAFLRLTFEFKADKHFTFDIDIPEYKLANAHWKINNNTNTIQIQDWKDKDSDKSLLLELSALKENGKTVFIISEMFFSLEVVRE